MGKRQQRQDIGGFDSLTAWQFFFVSAMLCEINETLGQYKFIAEVLEQFLKQGTDPYCQIRIAIRKGYEVTLSFLFRDAESHHSWKFIIGNESHISDQLQWAINRCQDLRGRPHFDFYTDLREEYSLREIIAGSYWTNREDVLKLVDSYSESQD
jgi:hypothetical protein